MPNNDALIWYAEGTLNSYLTAYESIPLRKREWRSDGLVKSAIEIINHVSYWNLVLSIPLFGLESLDVEEDQWMLEHPNLEYDDDAYKKTRNTGVEFLEFIRNASDEELSSEVELPWGTRTKLQVIYSNLAHITYHEGQLNYIQTLLGDQEDHY
jgi:hypothetical protein